MNNLNVFADATIPGGTYDNIRIFGSADVTGDAKITNMDVYGSADFLGNAEITNLKVFGSCDFKGKITVKYLDIKGSCDFYENINVEILKVYGSVDFKANISRAKEVNIFGDVDVKVLEADKISIKGYIDCKEQLNGETIEVSTNSGSDINEIVGSSITIKPNNTAKMGLFRKIKPINIKTIEGDNIYLEHVHAKTVRGKDIKIGPDCKIDMIEYHGTIEVDPNSEIKEQTQI